MKFAENILIEAKVMPVMSFLFVCFAFSDALNSIQSLHMGCHKRASGL